MEDKFKVNFSGYEASVLGRGTYTAILNSHNIFTKKHTKGRVKACKQHLKEAVEYALNERKESKKEA